MRFQVEHDSDIIIELEGLLVWPSVWCGKCQIKVEVCGMKEGNRKIVGPTVCGRDYRKLWFGPGLASVARAKSGW